MSVNNSRVYSRQGVHYAALIFGDPFIKYLLSTIFSCGERMKFAIFLTTIFVHTKLTFDESNCGKHEMWVLEAVQVSRVPSLNEDYIVRYFCSAMSVVICSSRLTNHSLTFVC